MVLGLLALAALYRIGGGKPVWEPKTVLSHVLGGTGIVIAGGNDAATWGIRCGWLTLLLVGLWALRRAMLAHSAYKPGPVDVQAFSADLPQGSPVPPVTALTVRFRKELSETELYAPTNLPAETPAENFLDLLGDVNLDPANLPTSLFRLFSHIRPRIAYRVSGVLTTRDKNPGCGVTVTLTSYAWRGSKAETLWGESWDEVTRTAAYWVVAALLPVTRGCRRAPWRDWRGRDLPYQLFAAYQEARRLSRRRDFDGALDQYYKAVQYDPSNVHLRNQIGATQEKLGLYLDALETYYGAIAIGGQGSERDARRLWTWPWHPRRFAHLYFLWGQPGALQARYRFAVVLGTAEQTARQWCKTDPLPHARALIRQRIRQSLAPAFARRYAVLAEDLLPPGVAGARPWLQGLLEQTRSVGPHGEQLVAFVLQRASAVELCRLAEDYPLVHVLRRFRQDDTSLTRSAMKVNRDVWGPLRLARVWAVVHGAQPLVDMLPERSALRWRRGVLRAAVRMKHWTVVASPDFGQLRRAVRRAKGHGFREWEGCYNAACAYAVALRDAEDEALGSALVDAACHELKEAARRAESGYARIRRSWLLFDDPDLDALRRTPDFVRFGREVFPHQWLDIPADDGVPAPPGTVPAAPTDVEMTAYDRDLLKELAAVMERVWHHRAARALTDVHTVEEWFVGECRVWRSVDVVSASQARSWPSRTRLVRDVLRAADEELRGRTELVTTVPEFDEVIAGATERAGVEGTDPERVRKHVWGLPEHLDTELGLLHSLVTADNHRSPINRSTAFLQELEADDASGRQALPMGTLAPVCDRYAALWHAFGSLFSALGDLADEPNGFDGFDEALCRLVPREPFVR
ncbi:hypothetical protein [Streptomyces sp. NPDC127190]|uniref:hypothetical protein n=1 Tax=unclassified Streptomyces TaxID=2593676 RepID=UPI003641C14B